MAFLSGVGLQRERHVRCFDVLVLRVLGLLCRALLRLSGPHTLRVSKELIGSASAKLKELLNSSNGRINLYDDLETVKSFVYWLYTGHVPEIESDTLVRLCLFGKQYEIRDLQNAAMQALYRQSQDNYADFSLTVDFMEDLVDAMADSGESLTRRKSVECPKEYLRPESE
ncbi:hypothetical protein M8818_000895 [Zalaria obscura]|uniref:Uncharacterized protein n=1 Tax=Zalaria obscura TaxID=2024903 RepID=A0ACC3SLK5_9PEZI